MTARAVHLVNLIFLVAWFAIAITIWPTLPEQLPIHFGVTGQADAWVAKSVFSWFGLPFLAFAMSVGIAGVGLLARGSPDLVNVPDKERFLRLSEDRRAAIIQRFVRTLAITGLLCSLMFAALHAGVYHTASGRATGLPWYTNAVMAAAVVGMIAVAILDNRAAGEEIARWSGE